jgi:hypothetical protein
VVTNYTGELIQHDSSHHLFSPPAREKWYLITSLDDFSRFILYATFLKRETPGLTFLPYRSFYNPGGHLLSFSKSAGRKRVKPPYRSVKDIFCLRIERTIDSYRKISLNDLQLRVNNAVPRKRVTLRIYPLNKDISEVRFWCDDKLIDVQRVKNSELKGVHF